MTEPILTRNIRFEHLENLIYLRGELIKFIYSVLSIVTSRDLEVSNFKLKYISKI